MYLGESMSLLVPSGVSEMRPPVHTYTHVLPKQSSYKAGLLSELLSWDLTLFRPVGGRGEYSVRTDWKFIPFFNKQAKATKLELVTFSKMHLGTSLTLSWQPPFDRQVFLEFRIFLILLM